MAAWRRDPASILRTVNAFMAGEWQISPSLNRMSRAGEEVRLEPKVMQVLECLAATPGEVVSRDDLVARVWPGVFVTDDVLHRAIRELRRAFGDDTAKPAYIETIRKRGYRLIAPVRPLGTAATSMPPPATEPAPLAATPPLQTGRYLRFVAASAALALTLGAVVFALASRPDAIDASPTSVRFLAMTSGPLNESDPALNADGTRLAFAMRPDGSEGPADLYLTAGAGQEPERLTAHPADDRYPAWSPDGASLAFIRLDGATCDVMLMAMTDRRERRLATCGNPEEPRVSWSANGEWLVESFAPGPDPIRGWQIARVSTHTGAREPLTLPVPATLGDYSPTVSPDGSRIAFVRGINGATADIFSIPFNGGAATRVTWDNQDLVGLDWSADGQSLVYATDRAGGYTIWRVPAAGGVSQLVVGGAAKLKHPSVARTDGRISYESWSIRDQSLGGATHRPAGSRRQPHLDPPSGGTDFGSVEPLARLVARWPPDRLRLDPIGRRRVMGRRSQRRQCPPDFLLRPRLDAPAALVAGWPPRADQRRRQWPDGFVRHRGGDVRRHPPHRRWGGRSGAVVVAGWSGGDLRRPSCRFLAVDQAGDCIFRPHPTDQQRWLFRAGVARWPQHPVHAARGAGRVDHAGRRWRAAAAGARGARRRYANFRVTPHGIFYVGVTADQIVVRKAPLTGGAGVDVAWLGNYSWPGFAVTPDGTRVLYGHWDRRESNIMAIDTR